MQAGAGLESLVCRLHLLTSQSDGGSRPGNINYVIISVTTNTSDTINTIIISVTTTTALLTPSQQEVVCHVSDHHQNWKDSLLVACLGYLSVILMSDFVRQRYPDTDNVRQRYPDSVRQRYTDKDSVRKYIPYSCTYWILQF